MARDLAAGLGFDPESFVRRLDFRQLDFPPTSECFAAGSIEAESIEELYLDSGKFDSAPPQANPAEQADLGRQAIYGTTCGHPAETRFSYRNYTRDSKSVVIVIVRLHPLGWTLPGAGTLRLIFSGT